MLCLTSDLKGWIRQSMAVLFKILACLKRPRDGKKLAKPDKFCLTGKGEEEGGKFQIPWRGNLLGREKTTTSLYGNHGLRINILIV